MLNFTDESVQRAIMDAFYMLQWYARNHTLACVVPAMFIAGAISSFLSKEAVLRHLGPKANKVEAYSVASVSGTVLAVCSCSVLPMFAASIGSGGLDSRLGLSLFRTGDQRDGHLPHPGSWATIWASRVISSGRLRRRYQGHHGDRLSQGRGEAGGRGRSLRSASPKRNLFQTACSSRHDRLPRVQRLGQPEPDADREDRRRKLQVALLLRRRCLRVQVKPVSSYKRA
jgi:hypothetical protein